MNIANNQEQKQLLCYWIQLQQDQMPLAPRAQTLCDLLAKHPKVSAAIYLRWQSESNIYQAESTHRSEEHTSELQSRGHLVCRLLLEKKKKTEKRIGRGVQKSHVARKGDHQTARDDNEHRHPRRRQGVRPAHAEGARPTHSPGAHTRN